ncbi:MAG: 50S ribosomal protein L13 [Rickettsiales bacterium]
MFKTYSLKHKEIDKKWYLIDAKDVVLGRLASHVAMLLMGKTKPSYSPHMDCGDYVIIINAEHVKLTGRKMDLHEGKKYHWHTGHPGGIKEISARDQKKKNASKVVIKAIERMITRNKLGRQRMTHLYVYNNEAHPHEAQKPEAIDMATLNPKNKR